MTNSNEIRHMDGRREIALNFKKKNKRPDV